MKKLASGYKRSHHRTAIFDLTPFSAMSPPDPESAPPSYEFALALLTESWIAEDGQEARSAAKVIEEVAWAMNLFAALAGKESA
jgi:hypothetical protein